jgi:aspartyl-tRNA(Asn)/glutamyl-tRNA(Gln) amidotransferase subunit B
MSPYTTIIGLEVHVQLLTESKMFCSCGTKFGEPANTQTCPVCLGLPGALPVINRKAFQLAMKTAVALNCEIPHFTKWDRKNYYYPDLPKGYQISQFDLPMSRNGWLEIETAEENANCKLKEHPCKAASGLSVAPNPQIPKSLNPSSNPQPPISNPSQKRIRILRAHLEEDAGKSMHDEIAGHSSTNRGDSRIDLNRAGTPLLEIVSEPDLRSPAEAKAYLTELKLLLNYLGVSDCNMQEGSLRVDANINLHIDSDTACECSFDGKIFNNKIATPIVEVKNMNSFRAVERALAYEAERQWDEWLQTHHRMGDTPKSTRGWDETTQTTHEQRTKEESSDYRYFPDPDLVPVVVTDAEIAEVRASLGELPSAIRTRLQTEYGLSPYDADVIVNQGRATVEYFLALADACGDAKAASNWIQQDVLRWIGERQATIAGYPVAAAALAELLGNICSGKFDTSRGRQVLVHMLEGKSLADAIRTAGIAEVDDAEVVALCQKLLADNPKIVEEVKAGKPKGLGALIGQAKKANPNVNPNRVREICGKMIEKM